MGGAAVLRASSHCPSRGTKSKPNCTRPFQASACVAAATISLAEASHMEEPTLRAARDKVRHTTKPEVSAVTTYTPLMEVGGGRKVNV